MKEATTDGAQRPPEPTAWRRKLNWRAGFKCEPTHHPDSPTRLTERPSRDSDSMTIGAALPGWRWSGGSAANQPRAGGAMPARPEWARCRSKLSRNARIDPTLPFRW
jgi:hypothetical protein